MPPKRTVTSRTSSPPASMTVVVVVVVAPSWTASVRAVADDRLSSFPNACPLLVTRTAVGGAAPLQRCVQQYSTL